MASDKPWGTISESDYKTPESFCSACLIDLNTSTPKIKSKCKLPVKEPGGALNRNGVHAAASRIHQTQAPPDAKRSAARKLVGYYRQLGETPPESIVRMAGR